MSDTGVLSFQTFGAYSAPDYENKNFYTTTVTASDGILSDSINVEINIININDNSPVFTSSATFSADENQTAIETVTATDADGDSLSFTVSGSELAITSSGVLMLLRQLQTMKLSLLIQQR